MEDTYGDVDNLPSLKVRKSLSVNDGIDDKAIKSIKRVFRKGVVGIMKLLLSCIVLAWLPKKKRSLSSLKKMSIDKISMCPKSIKSMS